MQFCIAAAASSAITSEDDVMAAVYDRVSDRSTKIVIAPISVE